MPLLFNSITSQQLQAGKSSVSAVTSFTIELRQLIMFSKLQAISATHQAGSIADVSGQLCLPRFISTLSLASVLDAKVARPLLRIIRL
jgi:hypothetical protein